MTENASLTSVWNSEQKFRHLFDNLSDSFILVDTSLKILQFNPALEQILEYQSCDLLNHNLLEFCYRPMDQLALLQGIERRRAGQKDSYEIILKSRTGRPIHTHISPAPFRDESGQVVGSFAVIKDLTELKEAQAKIAYQAQLLNQISEGVLVTDSEGNVQYWNKRLEQILGLTSYPINDTFISMNMQTWLQQLWNTTIFDPQASHQGFHEHELEYQHPEGYLRYLRLSCMPISDRPDQALATITVISDFTELIRSRREAELASQAKSNFLANISHDIRTPMIGIIGASDLLSQEELTSYQRELIATIQQCGEQMLGLINDILDLSRIEAGYAVSIEREFDIHQLLQECLLMIHTRVDSSQVSIATYIDPAIPRSVIGDPLQLRRVLLNLLSNAAKFTSQGYISIKVIITESQPYNHEELWIKFSVEDTGIGIPEESLPLIFDAFHQVSRNNGEGTGLGLTICRELVHLMGGTIKVNSKAGQGSAFTFSIPLRIPVLTASVEEKPSKPANIPTTSARRHILVVEDNKINRRILSYMLERKGYTVHAAGDGRECLTILEKQPVDLILMDIQMPTLDGYETIRLLRADNRYANLPVIALSAFTISDADKCLRAGFDQYLSKPFSSDQLYNSIAVFLDINHANDQAESVLELISQDLLPEFIEMMELDLARLKVATQNSDWETLAHIAHDIKGTAGIYGYSQISQLAAMIYDWAKAAEYPYIFFTLSQLDDLIQEIKASMPS